MSTHATMAWLSKERDVFVRDSAGRDHSLTRVEVGAMMVGSWKPVSAASTGTYSWPSWSPDGKQLACFRMPDESLPSARVMVLDPFGIKQKQVADLGKRLPIYLFWSPDNRQVAVLSQARDSLNLSIAPTTGTGGTSLADGSPLFFTWAGADRIATFIGSSQREQPSRLAVIDPAGHGATHLLPGIPGGFCAPLWMLDRCIYVSQTAHGARLVSAGIESTTPDVLLELDGLLAAMIASPDKTKMLVAVAAGGDGTPYRDLTLVDVVSGEHQRLAKGSWLAFWWLPSGEGAVAVRVDTSRNLLCWHRLDLDGGSELLVEMYPTRDLGFYLRFFEQYSQSHLLIDEATDRLLVAGGIRGKSEPQGAPRIWSVPLDGDDPEIVAEGVFAVFAPPAVAEPSDG